METFNKTGSYRLYNKPRLLIAVSLLTLLLTLLMSRNITIGFIAIILLLIIYLICKSYKKPSILINTILISSFLISGITRILPLPFGLSIDVLITLTWILILSNKKIKKNWDLLKNPVFYCIAIWAFYCFIQLFNPESKSFISWFYASRGIAFYSLLLTPLLFIAYNKPKDFYFFINTWFLFSILLGLYGAKQYWFGIFDFEQKWLDDGAHSTHVLWGKFTRMFSFLSDANQFGNSQGHAATVAILILLKEKKNTRKIFYGLTSIICLYGMIISGTRGAVIVPIIGCGFYLILSKNFKLLMLGSIVGGIVLYVMKYTYLFQGNAAIRRMRTAFTPQEDASFIVRVENRIVLSNYMSNKPFGGGIGSAGFWGKRFSPGTFLAEFETDGFYVVLFAETGIIGMYLYILLLIVMFYFMIKICWAHKNINLRNQMIAITATLVGIFFSNYSASVSSSIPTNIIVLFSLTFVCSSKYWKIENDKKFNKKI
jgi:hypothetical protein